MFKQTGGLLVRIQGHLSQMVALQSVKQPVASLSKVRRTTVMDIIDIIYAKEIIPPDLSLVETHGLLVLAGQGEPLEALVASLTADGLHLLDQLFAEA